MIERIEKLPEGLPENVVTARINALFSAYRDSVGVDIFAQTVDGKITAIFGGMDGSFSLQLYGEADVEELDSYFSFLSATVFCDAATADALHCEGKQYSDLYELTDAVETTDGDGHGRISDVYDVLKMGDDGDIALPPFDLWYTDLCVRFNHGSADFALCDGAVAVAGFVTDQNALITGVAVNKNDRKKGRGTKALKTLLSNIRKKHPSCRVFAATQNAGGFYIKNGFQKVGQVAVLMY